MTRSAREQGMMRVPELDGFRGIAIVAVLIYHLSPQAVISKLPVAPALKTVALVMAYPISSFGWAGVDFFFVLSGFLITSILLDAKEARGYFRNFYARRILRIFPIYYATLVVLFVIAPLLDASLAARPVYDEQIYFWTYLQNWLEAFRTHTGFQSDALGHTWSLAIEEQFYLVWPAVVLLLKPRQLVNACVACIVMAAVVRGAANAYASSAFEAYNLVHFNLFARFDVLALGALLACLTRHYPEALASWRERGGPKRALVFSAAVLVVVVSFHPVEPQLNSAPFRVAGYAFVAAIFALLLFHAMTGDERGMWRRLLRSRPLVYCGGVSYGLYMYHWPVYYFLPSYMRGGLRFAFPVVALGATFALAHASFRLFESPMLRLKRHFAAPHVGPVKRAASSG